MKPHALIASLLALAVAGMVVAGETSPSGDTGAPPTTQPADTQPADTQAEKKPVNEMCIVMPEREAKADLTVEHEGKVYAFCCKSCVRKFNKEPERYVKSDGSGE